MPHPEFGMGHIYRFNFQAGRIRSCAISARKTPVPKQTLRLVQSSFAKRYLMNAIFAKAWAVAVVME
jgi:hypothetical protein